jgi:teichuronic acid biosynthesis glycosyltransferase TuaG
MNLVSVIIPYYRKKEYFEKTLNSILTQSHKKIEIIIIYDDTNLQELTFLKKITKKDKRISIIINKKNLGAGHSRNIGINASKGKFIAFIDADDIWRKDKIYQQLKFMKKK